MVRNKLRPGLLLLQGAHHVLAVVEEPLRDGLHLRATADRDYARRRVADRLVHHAGLQDTPGHRD